MKLTTIQLGWEGATSFNLQLEKTFASFVHIHFPKCALAILMHDGMLELPLIQISSQMPNIRCQRTDLTLHPGRFYLKLLRRLPKLFGFSLVEGRP